MSSDQEARCWRRLYNCFTAAPELNLSWLFVTGLVQRISAKMDARQSERKKAECCNVRAILSFITLSSFPPSLFVLKPYHMPALILSLFISLAKAVVIPAWHITSHSPLLMKPITHPGICMCLKLLNYFKSICML